MSGRHARSELPRIRVALVNWTIETVKDMYEARPHSGDARGAGELAADLRDLAKFVGEHPRLRPLETAIDEAAREAQISANGYGPRIMGSYVRE